MKSSKALEHHTVPYTPMAKAKPSSPSHFLYVPACSMASRRDIEQSSYCTTPALSQGERTPPCGQATYSPEDELCAVNDALREKLLNEKTHGGLERVVLLETNEQKNTTIKEIDVEKAGVSAKDSGNNTTACDSSSSPSPGRGQEETKAEKKHPDRDTDTKSQSKGSTVQRAPIDIISDQNVR
ncbi:hypothetical protein PVAR5_8828 [Paecilomyces variotii No. 5]|uniref:Uncharacterized protein n=1 Tax=Byssochlamys spectabilis (strain No. 5 / NBRC 109023) TaxID=1356009 RepID=V5GGM5_BYSSN|nr:hypothetical protein PVAR5_8828 [Paecilomyces variotii No. 5]